MNADQVRVRFAPSPTGYLHVGGARTALFNWLFARQSGGTFILRIEDTDRDRSSDDMTRAILEGMTWLGLDWDEGPFHQADYVEQHRDAVQRLLDRNVAYRCFCTQDQLRERREAAGAGSEDAYRYDRRCLQLPAGERQRLVASGEPHTVRFRVPDGVTAWDDVVHGEVRFRNEDIEDFVILRSDGTPTYNLAVVADDLEMRITHVIRGDDHLSNTPKQILLYGGLDTPAPRFAHLPMILGPDGKRLSKRHGATAVGEYRTHGILPGALGNFLALLGWNPGDEQEIMSLEELITRFSLERVNRKSAVFDPEKLQWMNGQHLARTPASELLPLVGPGLVERGLTTEADLADRHDWFCALIELLKPRARVVDGIVDQATPFLAPSLDYEEAAVARHWKEPAEVAERLQVVAAALAALPEWEKAEVEATLRATAERLGVGFGKLVHPLRLALTGSSASPGIDDVIVQLGPTLVERRIAQAREFLAAAGGKGNS